MSESMDFGDYSRDRSRSPARNNYYDDVPRDRSRSPHRGSSNRRGRGGRGGRGGERGYQSSYRPRNDYRDDRSFRDNYRPQSSFNSRANDYQIKASRKYENSVFVGNLPYNCQWWELKDHFATIGSVVRADIVTDRGRSRGMGTVEYDSIDSARRAIDMFNRTEFKNREIFVREDLPPPEKKENFRQQERERYPANNGYDRYGNYDSYRGSRDTYVPGPPKRETFKRETRGYEVFIGNLPFSVRWQELKDLFKPYGEIERADVLENSFGKSRGMGTVYYYRKEDADNAIAKLNGYEWYGRIIEVRPSKFPRDSNAPVSEVRHIRTDGLSKNSDFTLGVTGDGSESETLYIGNLPWETAESDLFELFGSVATVERAELQYGRGGMSSGNAVVKFADIETAKAVIQQLDNYEYGGRNLKITFANYPTPEQLEALHQEIRENAERNAVLSAPAASLSALPAEGQPVEFGQQVQEQPVEQFGVFSPATTESSAPMAVVDQQQVEITEDADEMIEE